MTDLKPTPLYELHLQLGAKMTGFAGYSMPLQYPKGIIHEHLHCRSRAGLFDISHMGQCRILGGGAIELERLTPGGIVDLSIGQQKYTVLTNPDGGVIDDIIATRIEGGLSLVVNAGCKHKDFAYLCRQLSGACRLEIDADRALLALQGPEASAVLAKFHSGITELAFMQACPASIARADCTISRSGYTGEDGFEISLKQSDAGYVASLLLAEEGVEPIGLGARDTLRLEAGLCLYGHELNETISPIEAGLQWLCKKGHDDFPGADIIGEQIKQGPKRIRVGLWVEGRVPVREGCAISDADGNRVGFVTSGGYAPSLKRPVAMALIEHPFTQVGSELFATVRDQRVAVTVCHLPFVPHRYRRPRP